MNLNPFRASFRTQFLLGFLLCAGFLAYALYVQFIERIEPCPFCILQRIGFAALGIVFLIGGLHAPRGASGRRVYGVLALIAAIFGTVSAGRHVWVQVYPPPTSSCGASLSFLGQMMSWPEVLKKVLTAYGDCSFIDWTFLGLSMPAWCLIWFVVLGSGALYAGFRKR